MFRKMPLQSSALSCLSVLLFLFLLTLYIPANAGAGTTEMVSVSSSGGPGNYGSTYLLRSSISMSTDGRFVAFHSMATNLVIGGTNGKEHVFVRDRLTGVTEIVSVDNNEIQANGYSYASSISADGRFVAFHSNATNLVPSSTNGQYHVFVRDRQTGTTEIVSIDNSGIQGNLNSVYPSISADGRFVVFQSLSTNFVSGGANGKSHIFVRDRQTGTTEIVSIDNSGIQGNLNSDYPFIGANGRFVAFWSLANNLVANDTNGISDIFVRDRLSGITERVSVGNNGTQGYGVSGWSPSISADGRFVAFSSTAANLVSDDKNGTGDIFVRDRVSGTTEIISVDSNGTQANSFSYYPFISADGRFVVFSSSATNLMPGDTNGLNDIFIRDRGISNRPPVAKAGFGQTVNCTGPNGAAVTLDGSQSTDADGDALTYTWTGPFGTATGVNPTVTVPQGSYTITLTVADGKGGTASDTVVITVLDTTPPNIVANIVGTMVGGGWYTSDVNVSFTSSDSCSGVKEIRYRIDNGSEMGVSGASAATTITTDGTHTVTYYSVDNAGNVSGANSLTVKIDKALAVSFQLGWGGMGSTNGQFAWPYGVATDAAGNVYVVDPGNNRIQVFAADGTFLRQWGGYGTGSGQFISPYGIAIDAAGNVYVADTGNNRIQVFAADGTFLRRWGDYGTAAGQLNAPVGIAIDPATGNVYVAEYWNNRVSVFSSDGTFLETWGVWGMDDGQFRCPGGIAVDIYGNVYVADTGNHRIQVFTRHGRFIGAWGSQGTAAGQFGYPTGIAVDTAGNVYVSDFKNNTIQIFGGDGTYINTKTCANCGFGGIAVSATGVVYTTDIINNLVYALGGDGGGGVSLPIPPPPGGYTSSTMPQDYLFGWNRSYGLKCMSILVCRVKLGNYITTYHMSYSASDQPNRPWGVGVNSSGNVYVSDTNNHRIQSFAGDGSFLGEWGGLGTADGQFNEPAGIATDAAGNVYTADRNNHRVQVFTSSGAYLRQWGGYGTGPGQFNAPDSIAIDVSGNVYVADTGNHRIQVFDGSGGFLVEWGGFGIADGQFINPDGITVDAVGSVYVADTGNNRVQVFTGSGTFLRKWGGAGEGDGQLNGPHGIALDAAGNVYVADTGNHRIQVFENNGAFMARWGSLDVGGQMDGPWNIVVDVASGTIYVSDRGNNQIHVFEGYIGLSANAGVDRTIEQTFPSGAYVALDGSGSQGDILSYTWTWPGGPATGVNPTVLLPAGTNTVTLTVSSGFLSASSTVKITVKDTVVPITTAMVNGAIGGNGWYVSDANISFTASDSGSGVKEIRYSIDNGVEMAVSGASAATIITTDGTHTVTYSSVDNAGNAGTANSVTIKIDKTAPAITAVAMPAANANGWNTSDVTVTYNCVDSVSGIASCPSAMFVATEGRGQVITGTAADNAGNTASASAILNIDKTAPAITISGIADGAAYTLGLTPQARYTVVDAISGVATSSAGQTGGDGLGLGTFVYTVNAADNAGNAATAKATYSVIATVDGTISLVDQLVSSGAITVNARNSLNSKLNSALQALAQGNTQAAANIMQAFINYVNAQTGKNITAAAAATLINAANYIITH